MMNLEIMKGSSVSLNVLSPRAKFDLHNQFSLAHDHVAVINI